MQKRLGKEAEPMEILEWIRLILGASLLLIGLIIFFVELYGIFHFRYVLNRMHAAAMEIGRAHV